MRRKTIARIDEIAVIAEIGKQSLTTDDTDQSTDRRSGKKQTAYCWAGGVWN